MTDFFSIPVGDEQDPPPIECPHCQQDVLAGLIKPHMESQHKDKLHWSAVKPGSPRAVFILIEGGVPYVQHCPDDVEIYIRDLDIEAQADSFDYFGYKEQLY